MRNVAVFIAAAALAGACNGARSTNSTNDRNASPSGSAAAPASTPAQQRGTDPTQARTTQAVTLVGCLQGPAPNEPAGTSGARARTSGESSPAATDRGTQDAGSPYRLTNATAAGSDSAGTGSSGAGASGGPLVSGMSTFVLDGVPADAQGSVNKQVRVNGRLDATATGTDSTSRNPADARTAPGARRLTVESIQVIAQICSAGAR